MCDMSRNNQSPYPEFEPTDDQLKAIEEFPWKLARNPSDESVSAVLVDPSVIDEGVLSRAGNLDITGVLELDDANFLPETCRFNSY